MTNTGQACSHTVGHLSALGHDHERTDYGGQWPAVDLHAVGEARAD